MWRWSICGNQLVEAAALVSIGRDQDALDALVLLSDSACRVLGPVLCVPSHNEFYDGGPDQHKGCVIVQWTPDSQYRRI